MRMHCKYTCMLEYLYIKFTHVKTFNGCSIRIFDCSIRIQVVQSDKNLSVSDSSSNWNITPPVRVLCYTDGQGTELVLDHIVERKRMDDLSSSIIDKRFTEQKVQDLHCMTACTCFILLVPSFQLWYPSFDLSSWGIRRLWSLQYTSWLSQPSNH